MATQVQYFYDEVECHGYMTPSPMLTLVQDAGNYDELERTAPGVASRGRPQECAVEPNRSLCRDADELLGDLCPRHRDCDGLDDRGGVNDYLFRPDRRRHTAGRHRGPERAPAQLCGISERPCRNPDTNSDGQRGRAPDAVPPRLHSGARHLSWYYRPCLAGSLIA
jgi:hypothetical protein